MNIDWIHFTPLASLLGGIMLGIAAVGFILLNGRILGISGILGGLLVPRSGDTSWRLSFLIGLLLAPITMSLLAPELSRAPRIDSDNATVVLAGLMVGLGTLYGSGCTSGHGVCGLSRLSPRSLVATVAFMASAFAIVYVVRHIF